MGYTNLQDQSEQINLPAIMISYIGRIANTTKDHDMGNGFLLTLAFEKTWNFLAEESRLLGQ